jgi:hypothetical protein
MKKIIYLLVLIFVLQNANAQIDVPAPSPGASFTQKFGLTEIKMDYSRPSVNGRVIFGNILPFDSLWRTGANGPTTFTTQDSLTINGKGLPKGTYIILSKPGRTSWEIIFNKNPAVSYTNYIPQDDVLRISVPVSKTSTKVETFTISVSDVKSNNCMLAFEWDNVSVQLQLVHDVRNKVLKQIRQKNAGPTQSEYTAMARFYFENNESVSDALGFINKAVAMGETFANLRLQSLILAKSGDKKQAIIAAKKSLEKANAANNQDYIRMNKESIAEWEK